jgi:hypothetical protein
MYNPTRCICFAIVSKNQNWPIITSFPQVKEKQRWFPSLRSVEKLMQISFLKFWACTYYSMSKGTPTCSENENLY